VAWLETTYGIRIPPVDLVPENFQSVEIIAGYMVQLLGSTDGTP
jgi:acyl carrier protein